jgi:hypothetical protein
VTVIVLMPREGLVADADVEISNSYIVAACEDPDKSAIFAADVALYGEPKKLDEYKKTARELYAKCAAAPDTAKPSKKRKRGSSDSESQVV